MATILIKKVSTSSSIIPHPTELLLGELCMNTKSSVVMWKDENDKIKRVHGDNERQFQTVSFTADAIHDYHIELSSNLTITMPVWDTHVRFRILITDKDGNGNKDLTFSSTDSINGQVGNKTTTATAGTIYYIHSTKNSDDSNNWLISKMDGL